MVNQDPAVLDAAFAALADRTRRAIVERLALGPATVGELAAPHAMSLPAVSKHLTVLERAGLIERRRDGRVRRCSLGGVALADALRWMHTQRTFWESRLDALARLVETTAALEEPWTNPPPSPSGSNATSPPPGSTSSGRGRTPRS